MAFVTTSKAPLQFQNILKLHVRHNKTPVYVPSLPSTFGLISYSAISPVKSPQKTIIYSPSPISNVLISRRHFNTKLVENIPLTMDKNIFKFSLFLSNNERCLFAFKGDQTIKDFVEAIKQEDQGNTSISLRSKDGARISQFALLSSILPYGVELTLNSRKYSLSPSGQIYATKVSGSTGKLNSDEIQNMAKEIDNLQERLNLLAQKLRPH